MRQNTTIAARLRDQIVRRVASNGNDAGVALLSAILFMIIMAGLGMVIVSTVLGQVAPTYLSQKETQTVYGAQAGMQAALGMFRTAVYYVGGVKQLDPNGNGATLGDPKLLPCSITGTIDPSGTADGVGYTVAVSYYDADPTAHLTDSTWVTANQLTCTPGLGVSGISSSKPLAYAYLISTGTGNALPGTSGNTTPGNRSLGAVYQFKVSTVNIAGGLINDYNDNGAYCLSAKSAAVGANIQWLPKAQCNAANAALQNWSYGSDYEIKLSSSTANAAAGLCITGPDKSTANATQNATLQTCIAAPSLGRWSQLWSWYGSNTWQGSNPAITDLGSYNLGFASASPLTNQLLEVVYNGTSNGFSPSTEVGSGAAGPNTSEIVNYLEFGRCMDVTNASINSTNYLISYPCKQDPEKGGKGIEWNQKFYYQEAAFPTTQTAGPEPIIVNTTDGTVNGTLPSSLPSAAQYCMTTPGYPTTKATAGAIVYVYPCATTTNYNEWTRIYTANNYGGSYLFTTTTSTGTTLCLEVNPAITSGGWSELDVAACVGTNLGQKWNAPANYTTSNVAGYKEIGG